MVRPPGEILTSSSCRGQLTSIDHCALSTAEKPLPLPLMQMLQIDRATLSGVVTALVRKRLVAQEPHPSDLRQKVLHITASGMKLWERLPDPIELIVATAFDGVEDVDLETVVRVLHAATQRINNQLNEGIKQ
jgi:DNA-binding MarR family transcriptional regulator